VNARQSFQPDEFIGARSTGIALDQRQHPPRCTDPALVRNR